MFYEGPVNLDLGEAWVGGGGVGRGVAEQVAAGARAGMTSLGDCWTRGPQPCLETGAEGAWGEADNPAHPSCVS